MLLSPQNSILLTSQNSIFKPSFPRLSYTGSFTEKLLQRSQSQPSLFRSKPFMINKRNNQDDESSDLQFADATPSPATFSPIKKLTQLAPVITLEDV